MTNGSFAERVLVVDDDAFMSELVAQLLVSRGVGHVASVSDGRAALSALDGATERFDLVVCDLDMPGMDGIEFGRFLAERRFDGGILLMTGKDLRLADTVAHLYRRLGLGCVGAYAKPLDAGSLACACAGLAALRTTAAQRPSMVPLGLDDLRSGLDAGDRVEIVVQPKVSMSRRKVLGAECLARWRHPSRGVLGPMVFVPLAEESGLIGSVTTQVFRHALAEVRRWSAAGLDLRASVNVSMAELTRFDLPDTFADLAQRAGVPPGRIVLELTETSFMHDECAALEILARFRLKGFALSIDDFGTGYATLGSLKALPFNELKVDRAFVHGASRDHVARTILESSVRMGRLLGMSVVAEGAETADDLALLGEVGCDVVQGFVVAKPMPPGELIAWKAAWESGAAA